MTYETYYRAIAISNQHIRDYNDYVNSLFVIKKKIKKGGEIK